MFTRFPLAFLILAVSLAPAAAKPPRHAAPPAREEQVRIETKIITIADDFFEGIGANFSIDGVKVNVGDKVEEVRQFLDRGQADDGTPVFLDAKQKREFLEALTGDIRTNIAHTLKMVVSNGKLAVARRTVEYPLATGQRDRKETLSTGFELSVRPNITADGHAVALDLKTSLKSLDAEERQPRLTTLSLEEELIVPADHTVLLGGWKRMSEGRVEFGPPSALSKIPYVNRLFRDGGYTHAVENVLVMVTVKIVSKETAAKANHEE